MDKLRSMLGRPSEGSEPLPTSASSGSVSSTGASTPGSVEAEERGILAEALDTSSLSWSTRVQGFAACFVLGAFISVLACVMFSITFNLYTFGILYSLGNVVAICSTLFLMGPTNQIKRMFNETRWIASTVMLVFLVLTLISAFVLHKKGLTILFCIFQFLAMTWYSISYIPFARDAVKKFFDSLLS